MLCRHCNNRKPSRPKGLCWTCYYTPGIRTLYPSTSKYAVRGIAANFNGRSPLPPPTAALPGTPEKVAVLVERARLHQSLWHPLDAVVRDAGTPANDIWLAADGLGVGTHTGDRRKFRRRCLRRVHRDLLNNRFYFPKH